MSNRFGYEWKKYNSIRDEYRENYRQQFLNWTHPLTPDFYKGKIILDAGCGMGRNSYWCLEWGAKELVACDNDDRSVAAARQTLSKFSNVTVENQDLEHLSWENKFDYIFSIGVIHHTVNPKNVMKQLYRALKPEGEILLWVYSREGNETLLNFLQPIRHYLTSRLPLFLVHVLAYIASIPLYIYLQILSTRSLYLRQVRTFSFTHFHSIIFDQLLPPIARYYTQEQARALMSGFIHVQVYRPPNNNGWILRGVKN